MIYTYVATRKDGTAVAGKLDGPDVAGWTKARFESGWRDLRVYRDTDGVQVAGIDPPVKNRHRRRWWAEVAADLPDVRPADFLRSQMGWGAA